MLIGVTLLCPKWVYTIATDVIRHPSLAIEYFVLLRANAPH